MSLSSKVSNTYSLTYVYQTDLLFISLIAQRITCINEGKMICMDFIQNPVIQRCRLLTGKTMELV